MLFGQRLSHSKGVVAGAVIHDDDFDGAVVLRQHAFHRLAQLHWAVVNRDDGANESFDHADLGTR